MQNRMAVSVSRRLAVKAGAFAIMTAWAFLAQAQSTMTASQLANSVLTVTSNAMPSLSSDAAGLVAIETTTFDAITNMSTLGNGRMFLGTINNGTFSGATLAPGLDSVYRLGGGASRLSFNDFSGQLTVSAANVLTGADSSLQIGLPTGWFQKMGYYFTYGFGWVYLPLAQNYGGGTTVNAYNWLEGVAQASGSPFGSSSASVTLNGGSMQLDGVSSGTSTTIGTLKVNGYGIVKVNQAGTQVTTFHAAGLSARSASAPYGVLLNGSSAATLGGKERIVFTSPPAVVNNMVAPWLLTSSSSTIPYDGVADFLTYNAGSDGSGTIGFTSASAYYANAADAATFQGLPGTNIANVTASINMTGPANVYALRLGSGVNLGNDGTRRTITIGNGGLLSADSGTIDNDIVFGAEAVIHVGTSNDPWDNQYSLTLSGNLHGTNGLTKIGGGSGWSYNKSGLVLSGDNTGLTGTIAVVRGTLTLISPTALGPTSNHIYFDGCYLLPLFGSPQEFNWPIVLGPSGAEMMVPWGRPTTLASPITGAGGLNIQMWGAGHLWVTNSNNTYGGGTALTTQWRNNDNIYVTATSSLGVGDVLVTPGGEGTTLILYGDRNIGGGDFYGNNTTNRQARLTIQPNCYVYFYSAAPQVGSLSGDGNLYFQNNTVLTVGGDNSSTIFSGTIQQGTGTGGSLRKTGSGIFAFRGNSLVTGTTVVSNGTFEAGGTMAGGITVYNGGTLTGTGSVGAVTLNSGATFAVTFESPTNYTQLVVNGPASLGGATLQINLNYVPVKGNSDTFYILRNASGSATTGTFAGLPEGSLVHLPNGYYGHIRYIATADGTSGNDIVITGITKGMNGSVLIVQ